MTSTNSDSSNPQNMAASEGQISAALTLPQGMGLQTMPIMLSVSLPEKNTANSKMSVLPPVLQLIQQSGLQTLSQIFPQVGAPLTSSSQATSIQDYTTPAHPCVTACLTDTSLKPPRTSFDLSSILKLGNPNELVSIQNRSSLANASLSSLANIVQETTNSQVLHPTLNNSSEQAGDNGESSVIHSSLSSSQTPAVLQNLSVQDAIAVHLGGGEFARSDLISPQLEALVSNSAFIQQCANQDLASGQYLTNQSSHLTDHQSTDSLQTHSQHAGESLMSVGDQCQMTSDLQSSIPSQMLCTNTDLGHQPDRADLTGQEQLTQHHIEDIGLSQQKCNDVAIGNEMTVVGYNPQDYLQMQTNLASAAAAYIPISEELPNQDPSTVAASLASQIEAISSAITSQDPSTVAASLASQIEAISSAITSQSGFVQLPTTGSNPQCPSHLVDLVLKLAGKRDANTPPDTAPALAVSVPVEPVLRSGLAIPEVFVSFCVECDSASSETSPCLVHNPEYTTIGDTPIPSRARASLPTCLYLKSSDTPLQKVMGVYKKLEALGKTKKYALVGQWARSIGNHVYWCAASSDGDGELVRQKWTSITNHIANIHESHGDKFQSCQHGNLDRIWFKPGSKALGEVKKIVHSKLLLKDIGKLSPAEQTSSLESYHNIVNFFAPKSTHYFYNQMKARVCLAALHFNANSSRSQTMKDGKGQYRVSFPKSRKGDPVAKEVKVKQNFGVWANSKIKANSKFGPLVGKVSSSAPGESKLGSLPEFKVIYSDKVDQYDLEDEQECNWLKFVQMARTEAAQNMVVTQLGSEIFFFTTKEIYPGDELLFWYSKDYARFLGVPVSPETKKVKTCYVCGKVFVGRLNLRAHQKLVHADVVKRKWNCNMCEQGFTSSAKLNDHMNIHMGIKPHTCQVCGKRFTDQSNLRQHLHTHTNVKRFSCTQCGNQFRQKIHLQTHMLTHTGEKNLQCRYCVKKFARESDRKQHQYQHTKEKIYQCMECNKIFYKLQNYKRHALMHTGEKNHACPKCQKRFYTKYHLQRHSKTCKGATTKIYLNKHEKNLNLEEIANELTAGPSASRTMGNSTATS